MIRTEATGPIDASLSVAATVQATSRHWTIRPPARPASSAAGVCGRPNNCAADSAMWIATTPANSRIANGSRCAANRGERVWTKRVIQ